MSKHNGLVITDKADDRRKVYDHNSRHVATVGPHAGLPTVARFLGHNHAKQTVVNGKRAWKATEHPNQRAPRQVSAVPLAKSRETAKGSVGLTLAETSARGATQTKVGGQS
jgi:hypothetical protein